MFIRVHPWLKFFAALWLGVFALNSIRVVRVIRGLNWEAELLKVANGPHAPMREGELWEIADRALSDFREFPARF